MNIKLEYLRKLRSLTKLWADLENPKGYEQCLYILDFLWAQMSLSDRNKVQQISHLLCPDVRVEEECGQIRIYATADNCYFTNGELLGEI